MRLENRNDFRDKGFMGTWRSYNKSRPYKNKRFDNNLRGKRFNRDWRRRYKYWSPKNKQYFNKYRAHLVARYRHKKHILRKFAYKMRMRKNSIRRRFYHKRKWVWWSTRAGVPRRSRRLRRKRFMVRYKRWTRAVRKKTRLAFSPQRLNLQLALLSWGVSGNARLQKWRKRYFWRRRRRALSTPQQRHKLTRLLPLALGKYSTKQLCRHTHLTNWLKQCEGMAAPMFRHADGGLVSRVVSPSTRHLNFTTLLRRFQRLYMDTIGKSKHLASPVQNLRTDLRSFMKGYYKQWQKCTRIRRFNEKSYYYTASYDKRIYKKRKLYRVDRYVRNSKPWLKFLMYKPSTYKLIFYKAYLRERSLYKTKRNKLYRLFIQLSHNKHRPPKFRANKRGGNRSFHYQLLLKKILYPVFGRRTKSNTFRRYSSQHRCIKSSVSGRFRLTLNRLETSPTVFATKVGWAPTIEWSRHYARNSWYSISREVSSEVTAMFPPEVRSIPQEFKFPLHADVFYRHKLERSILGTFEPFSGDTAVVDGLNPGDIMHTSPHVLNVIRSHVRNKPKWNKPILRSHTDINTNRSSVLVLNAPNVRDIRERDRNTISSLRSLV